MPMIEVDEKEYETLKKSVDKLETNNKKLTSQLDSAREERDQAKTAAEEAEKKAEDAVANAAGNGEEVEALKKQHAKQIEKLEARATTAETRLNDTVTDSAVKAAIAEAGVKENLRPAAEALIKTQNAGKIKLGSDNIVTIDGANVVDHIKDWIQTDEGAGFVPSGNGGGGSNNQPGPNNNPNNSGGGKDAKANFGGSTAEVAAAIEDKFGAQLEKANSG